MNNHIFFFFVFTFGSVLFLSADELDVLIYNRRGLTPPKEMSVPTLSAGIPDVVMPKAESLKESGALKSQVVPSGEDQVFRLEDNTLEVLHTANKTQVFPAGSHASRLKDGTLEIVPAEGVPQVFSVGSRAFRLKDGTLKVVPDESNMHVFPAGSQVFSMKDGSIKVMLQDDANAVNTAQSSGSEHVALGIMSPVAHPSEALSVPIPKTTPVESVKVDHNGFRNQNESGIRLEDGARDALGYYVSVRGFGAEMNTKGDGGRVRGDDLDAFFGASIAFGHRFNDYLRVEIEGGGAYSSKGDCDATIALGLMNFVYSYSFSENFHLLLGTGAGALYYKEAFKYTEYYYTTSYYTRYYYRYSYYGYSYGYPRTYSYRQQHSYRANGSGDVTLPVFNLMAGLSYDFTDALSFDVAFRYMRTPEGDYKSDEVGDADVKLELVGGYVGLTYHF